MKRTITGGTHRIADVALDGRLDSIHFVDARLVGPAVLAHHAGSWFDFEGSARFENVDLVSVTWIVPKLVTHLSGAYFMTECIFERCTFVNIGFALAPDEAESFVDGLQVLNSGDPDLER